MIKKNLITGSLGLIGFETSRYFLNLGYNVIGIDNNFRIKTFYIKTKLIDRQRMGDHKWWINDNKKFQNDFPQWQITYILKKILLELLDRYD